MPKAPQRFKVQFDVPEELRQQLDKVLPWGARKVVFVALTEQIVALAERVGRAKALGFLMTGSVKVTDLLNVEETDGRPGNPEGKHHEHDGGGNPGSTTGDPSKPSEETGASAAQSHT